jgi:hypothetical protein
MFRTKESRWHLNWRDSMPYPENSADAENGPSEAGGLLRRGNTRARQLKK